MATGPGAFGQPPLTLRSCLTPGLQGLPIRVSLLHMLLHLLHHALQLLCHLPLEAYLGLLGCQQVRAFPCQLQHLLPCLQQRLHL